MTSRSDLTFSGRTARRHYLILMALFRLSFNRWLFGIFTRGLSRFFSRENAVALTHPTGGQYKIYLDDGYWTRFALYRRDYEPEVAALLCAAAGKVDLFCDMGANKGYWTTFASTLFQRIIAVEASSHTYKSLTENIESLTNVRSLWAAVHARSNEEMTFVNVHNSHASARLGDTAGDRDSTETVETVAIDDLISPGQPAVIKLDVEGAEIAAIDGAERALADGSVLIFEDHGNDPTCAPSAHLLADPEMRLYFALDMLKPVTTVAEIRALKTDRYTGYNLLAGRAGSALLRGIVEDFAIR